MKKSLHQEIKEKSKFSFVLLERLKPNSLEVAKRMIANGELIKSACGKGWISNEVAK